MLPADRAFAPPPGQHWDSGVSDGAVLPGGFASAFVVLDVPPD